MGSGSGIYYFVGFLELQPILGEIRHEDSYYFTSREVTRINDYEPYEHIVNPL